MTLASAAGKARGRGRTVITGSRNQNNTALVSCTQGYFDLRIAVARKTSVDDPGIARHSPMIALAMCSRYFRACPIIADARAARICAAGAVPLIRTCAAMALRPRCHGENLLA